MFVAYEKYLLDLNLLLDNYFKEQEPYIFCKKGCSLCCSCGEYPMSRIEFLYLLEGYKNLDTNSQNIVKNRIKKLKKDFFRNKNDLKQSKFEYKCPFLIGDSCSVYSHRSMICRTFGLIKKAKTIDGYDVAILPDCVHQGLNYSNVYNSFKNQFDDEKLKSFLFACEPEAYDITLQALYKNAQEDIFGEKKNLIEFFMELDL